ncbi:ATP-grasp domain-containing protein [Saccharomonospora iraqiensis]|uniref:ATP-grasp domain-containing protein n=1 Tax=Saccharomonospora iraqiensis TaxID=52698 RepID=UPI0003F976C6|nr:ATP-grasp domain-containing protein [Saccharomonospora iraqiensis]
MPENVFVLGLDDGNLALLRRLPGAADLRFHTLLDISEVRIGYADYRRCLTRAEQRLETFDGSIDAITGYWDFPVTSLVPVLCERYGLPSTSLESIVKCEHKYWSRLEQAEVVDAYPRFGLLDPATAEPALPPGLEYPVWLKPVKSASSKLAFRVRDEAELVRAVSRVRAEIDQVGGPFEAVLERVRLPPAIADVPGTACLVEEAVTGRQVTVEGYRYHHEPHVYGVIDSVTYPDSSSFLRYQYPSTLPPHLIAEVSDIAKRIAVRMNLRSTTFDVEFFVDVDTGRVSVLEVNPRLSQSHARLFEHVDGVSNLHCMVNLALGRDPAMPYRRGPYGMAAKCFLRRFTDGVVRRVPTAAEIARLEAEIPGLTVDVTTAEGNVLSDQYARDSYSYELADVHLGARDADELDELHERCVRSLRFEIDDRGGPDGPEDAGNTVDTAEHDPYPRERAGGRPCAP